MSAPKSGKVWDNPQLLVDLIVGLYEVAENAKLLGPAAQTAVQKHMTDQGHAVTWSAIRQHVQKLRKTRDATGVRSAGGTPTKSPAAKKASTPAKRPRAKVIEPKLAMDSQDEDDEIGWAGVKKEEEDTASNVLLNKRPVKRAKKSATLDRTLDEEV